MDAIHVHLEGLTAFFRQIESISGKQMTLPCPPYSTILGLISNCAGKIVTPADTRIGYEFRHASEGEDLETTHRLQFKRGKLKPHQKGNDVLRRLMHFRPKLDLYLTNLGLRQYFEDPISTPTLGRSNDVCCITVVEQVELTPADWGMIGSTLIDNDIIPSCKILPGYTYRCTEWFRNDITEIPRTPQVLGFYHAIEPVSYSDNWSEKNSGSGRVKVSIPNLYHPSNFDNKEDVIYLHEWSRRE